MTGLLFRNLENSQTVAFRSNLVDEAKKRKSSFLHSFISYLDTQQIARLLIPPPRLNASLRTCTTEYLIRERDIVDVRST